MMTNWQASPPRQGIDVQSHRLSQRQEIRQRQIKVKAQKIAFDCLKKWIDQKTEFLFNRQENGRRLNSCSAADSGVTGRKLVVQFYGGYPGAQMGGGSVVNKSSEKVDCSAAFGPVMWQRILWLPASRLNVPSNWLMHWAWPNRFPFMSILFARKDSRSKT